MWRAPPIAATVNVLALTIATASPSADVSVAPADQTVAPHVAPAVGTQVPSKRKVLEARSASNQIEPVRVSVGTTGPARGPANAPVTIVEFADFQCPFCARLQRTLDQVREKYGDKVRIVYRQRPLSMHDQAWKASEASLCANDQGKFWEMHDAMFENQQQLATESLKAKAAELGLNAEQFNSCLDGGKYASNVQIDLDEGAAAGVTGTPAMFVNGRFVNGAAPLEQITSLIDDELRRAGIAGR